jgi:uncharacterized membrane protein
MHERAHEPGRVLALSDGVFAIVLTLLVLELHVPELAGGQTLRDALREVRPSFTAFSISFVVIAIAWVGHRDLFSLIRRTDRALVWLNIIYMFPLSLLPFGAALISQYDRESTALALYGIILVAISATRLGIWWYATGRTRLLYVPIDAQSRRTGALLAAVPGIVYAIGAAIASAAPTASLAIYAGVPIAYFLGITFVRTSASTGSAETDFT